MLFFSYLLLFFFLLFDPDQDFQFYLWPTRNQYSCRFSVWMSIYLLFFLFGYSYS